MNTKNDPDKQVTHPPSPPVTLLACPFCGGEASSAGEIRYMDTHQAWWKDGTRVIKSYFCKCMECGITNQGLLGHQAREKAIEHWNTRQANDEVRHSAGKTECDQKQNNL